MFLSRYESCQIEACPPSSDYRLEQCRTFNGNNFNIEDLPKSVKWVPKYSGSEFLVHALFCVTFCSSCSLLLLLLHPLLLCSI